MFIFILFIIKIQYIFVRNIFHKGKEKKQKIEVTEMFVAKACRNRIFGGILTRMVDDYDNPIVFSRILMEDDGLLCAQASDQKELANNLNTMAHMIVFEGLHDDRGKTKEIFGTNFFLN
jgi:hypothetical protein